MFDRSRILTRAIAILLLVVTGWASTVRVEAQATRPLPGAVAASTVGGDEDEDEGWLRCAASLVLAASVAASGLAGRALLAVAQALGLALDIVCSCARYFDYWLGTHFEEACRDDPSEDPPFIPE